RAFADSCDESTGTRIAFVEGMDEPPKPNPSGLRPRAGRVLVVDDDELLRRALARLISTTCEVAVAASGESALAQIASGDRFDVILCDVYMPKMDGRAFYEKLRIRFPREVSKIVFMSGGIHDFFIRAFFESIPNVLLDKPLDMGAFDRIVADRLRLPRVRTE